jgi:hypothetical protein
MSQADYAESFVTAMIQLRNLNVGTGVSRALNKGNMILQSSNTINSNKCNTQQTTKNSKEEAK